ncbi:hypothetical protein [Thermoclostridium stercorarium]|uniref:hypothetical protein n=1 Tax=Thermoclostridium stercorarium TaxID=1510 RepID=UPI000B310164|nr:hypothetical protein [Thermoclostridium stercorarium]
MNEIMIVLITATVSVLTILYFKDTGKNRIKTADLEENRYAIEAILAFIREAFNNILKTNLYELNITREEFEKRMHNRNRLRRALKNCTYGDINAKNYVKDFIKDILVRSYEIDENNVNNIISFDNPRKLSAQDKFEILLYHYKKKYGNRASKN